MIYDLQCPKCEHDLRFLDQVKEWVEMGENDMLPGGILNIWCKTCKSMTTNITWDENGEEYEIEMPELRDITGGFDRLVLNHPKGDTHETKIAS